MHGSTGRSRTCDLRINSALRQTDSRLSGMVRDPGVAPGLCLYPKQVGRYLPMSLILKFQFWSGVRELHSPSRASDARGPLTDLTPVVKDGRFELPLRRPKRRVLPSYTNPCGGSGGIRTHIPEGWLLYRQLNTLSQTCSALPLNLI